MAFTVQQESDQRTYRLAGELDLATAGQLMDSLEPAVQGAGDLRLDLEALEFMDSSGIYALITLCRELRDRGRVVLRSPCGEVARVLQMVRADTFPNLVIVDDGSPGRGSRPPEG
jgi:anti-sigma B factor antagonist